MQVYTKSSCQPRPEQNRIADLLIISFFSASPVWTATRVGDGNVTEWEDLENNTEATAEPMQACERDLISVTFLDWES